MDPQLYQKWNKYSNTQYDVCIISVPVLIIFYYYWCTMQNNHDTNNKHVQENQLWVMNDVASFQPLKYINAQIYQTCKLMSKYMIWCMHHICASVCFYYLIYYYWCTMQNNHDTNNIHMHKRQLWAINDVASFWVTMALYHSRKKM